MVIAVGFYAGNPLAIPYLISNANHLLYQIFLFCAIALCNLFLPSVLHVPQFQVSLAFFKKRYFSIKKYEIDI